MFVGSDIHTAATRPDASVIIGVDAGQGQARVYRRAV
jgi:hypothetical protein